jgi:molybdate/tungstate transport system ATP-binding protein
MIQIEQLCIQAGTFHLHDISLCVPSGSYGMLMGKTGCGKTTILEAIAGLKPITSGRIILAGREVTHLKPAERNLGYVPQDGALFSTMSVREHLSFALTIRRAPRKQIEARVLEQAQLLDLAHLLDRFPKNLSGGEKQRVAIGRALAFHPQILLLDEPLSALDDDTRDQMYRLLRHIQQQTGVTTLHVTHHQQDVQQLADCLFRLDNSQLKQQVTEKRRTGRAAWDGPPGPSPQ